MVHEEHLSCKKNKLSLIVELLRVCGLGMLDRANQTRDMRRKDRDTDREGRSERYENKEEREVRSKKEGIKERKKER
jgi:hypothetical protein